MANGIISKPQQGSCILTTNMEICVDDPIATPNVMSCRYEENETKEEETIGKIAKTKRKQQYVPICFS